MTRTTLNIQDTFLNHFRRHSIAVEVTLLSGAKLQGQLKGFDNFTLVLEENSRCWMIYKHAVAMIQPLQPVPDLCGQALREAE